MVGLDTIREANTALAKTQPYVAVFIGGTSGIGEHTIRALANTRASSKGKGLRVYIVGRKAEAAQNIISDCLKECPEGKFQFVQVNDLSLIKNVKPTCEKITQLEKEASSADDGVAKVDLLVMSMACAPLGPRRETSEGLAAFPSLVYYARMRFTQHLLPLLLSAPSPAHIISVYAGGMEASLFPTDLSLRNPGRYSLAHARSHITYMTTLFMERLVRENPGKLAFTHVFPGLVLTNGFNDPELPGWFKFVWKWGGAAIGSFFAVAREEAGERTLFLGTSRFGADGGVEDGRQVEVGANGVKGSGVYAVGASSQTIVTEKMYTKYREEGLAEKVWKHTMDAFREIEAGGVFTR